MLASDWFMVLFRIVHIVAGVFWVGSVWLFVVFLQPTAASVGPAGAPFMAELLGRRRLVDGILTVASVSVVGGLFLYWHDWHLFTSFGDWIGTRFGATLTIGMVAALTAFSFGVFVTRPNVGRLLRLGRQVAESGGPPSPETATEIGAIQARLRIFARMSLILLIVAVLAMSTARYL